MYDYMVKEYEVKIRQEVDIKSVFKDLKFTSFLFKNDYPINTETVKNNLEISFKTVAFIKKTITEKKPAAAAKAIKKKLLPKIPLTEEHQKEFQKIILSFYPDTKN